MIRLQKLLLMLSSFREEKRRVQQAGKVNGEVVTELGYVQTQRYHCDNCYKQEKYIVYMSRRYSI